MIRWLVNRWPIAFAGWLPLPKRNRRGWWKPTKAGNPHNEWMKVK